MKGLGCAMLRDGVYLLPAGRGLRQALRMHAEDIKQGGGSAYLLNVANPSTEEKTDFQAMFDRSEDYRAADGARDGFSCRHRHAGYARRAAPAQDPVARIRGAGGDRLFSRAAAKPRRMPC